MIIQELDPSVEVVHLRRLLDIQPACLLRLAADGTILAVNDAALVMLGGESCEQTLGRDFALWIPPEQREPWKAFTLGVVRGSPSSIECDVAGASGTLLPTLFQAIPLADHPDGVPSMAVTARVITAQRELEATVTELRKRVQEHRAELERREEALAAAEGARRAADEGRARALAEVRQLEMALDGFANRQRASAEADRSQLEAAVQQAREALARSEQREQSLAAERDGLWQRLEQALAGCQDRDAALGRLEAAHDSLVRDHAAAVAERDRLVSALREHAAQMHALATGTARTDGSPAASAQGGGAASPVRQGGARP